MINIFGAGFVGGEFAKLYPDAIINRRNDYQIKTDNVVYFISTIDNYNIFSDPYLDINTNLTTLIRVLESGKDRSDLTFNFISSWFVYGPTALPAKEDSPCDPRGFYSITKRAAEQLLISYCKTYGINYRIIRLGNIIGINDNKVSAKKNALQYMIKLLKNNKPVDLYDNGTHSRDYIDIEDTVRAIKLIVEKGPVNQIYNVGNGEQVKIIDIINYVIEKTQSKSIINSVTPPLLHCVVQPQKDFYFDITKLQSLGYQRTVSLWQSIDRILND